LLLLVLVAAHHITLVNTFIAQERIKHVVVLMLENRSFDHLLGFLKRNNSKVDGLFGNETNPYSPFDPSLGNATVSDDAAYTMDWDPNHSHSNTDYQIFGYGPQTDPAPMSGFVYNNERGQEIMRMFNPTTLSTMNTLANEFGVIDRWYSSVPGPTQVNRMFVHAATSDGRANNPSDKKFAEGFISPTIFLNLAKQGYDWRCYFGDVPSIVLMDDVREPRFIPNYRPLEMFADDCAKGHLPEYTWIEPRWYSFLYNFPASDEHPPHDMKYGEYLIAHIYKHLRASPIWNETLFIITYDEHGGFYDHSSPPQKGVPSPDGKTDDSGFQFDRLGVRIPLVVASPWINRQSVFSDAPPQSKPTPTSQFDHSSIPATLKKLFELPDFLTKRDAWANTFDFIVEERTEPRTDCPMELPVPGHRWKFDEWERFTMEGPTEANIALGESFGYHSSDKVTDLQVEMLLLICNAAADNQAEKDACHVQIASLHTEHEAALFAQSMTKRFLSKKNN